MNSLKNLADRLKAKGIDVEYFGPKTNPNSYMLHRFIRFYLSLPSISDCHIKEKTNNKSNIELREYIEKTLSGNISVCMEETECVITLLRNIGCSNEQRIKQYSIIKEQLIAKKAEDLFANVFSLLNDVFDSNSIKAPILQVLFDNYGLFITRLFEKKSKEEIANELEEYTKLKRQLLLLSVLSTPRKNVFTWTNSLTDEISGDFPMSEPDSESFDEQNHLSNMVIYVEPQIYKSMENVEFFPWYYSDDVDSEYVLTGDMITIVDKSSNKYVTYQIFDHHKFDSYVEMFSEMGTSCFGFPDESAETLAALFTELFNEVAESDECLALFVTKTI